MPPSSKALYNDVTSKSALGEWLHFCLVRGCLYEEIVPASRGNIQLPKSRL